MTTLDKETVSSVKYVFDVPIANLNVVYAFGSILCPDGWLM